MNTMRQLTTKKPQGTARQDGSGSQKRCQSVSLRVRNIYRGMVSTPKGSQQVYVGSESPLQIRKQMSVAVPLGGGGGHLRSPTPECGPQLMVNP